MKLLEPKLSILDETDSGLDIDALRIVADGVNSYERHRRQCFFDYNSLSKTYLDYIKPDFIHVLIQWQNY